MRCDKWRSRHGSDSGPPDIATRRQLPMTLMKVMSVVPTISVVNGRSGWRRDAPKKIDFKSSDSIAKVLKILYVIIGIMEIVWIIVV